MANRAKPAKKQPVWLHPVNAEVEYTRFLLNYVDFMAEQVQKHVIAFLPTFLEQSQLNKPRTDDWTDDVEAAINQTRLGVNNAPVGVPSRVAEFANKTNVWNDKEWRKQLHAAFGTDVFQREPWLNETLNSWTKENTSLIKTMSDDYISQVEGTVQRGIRSGQSVKNLTRDIQERTGATKSRAKLIARDQTSKLNGQLTELRQTNIGVKKYVWQDSDDKRVRSSHHANDGKTFSWNKAPANTGHPGEDYQCRCWAEPIFDEIKKELGMEKGAVVSPPLPPRPAFVTKSYKTKASAQSARSRAGLTGKAEIRFNASTGKWEFDIPTGVKPPVPKPVGPKPTPKPVPKPEVKPPIAGGERYGEYSSKASAQSTISKKKLKGAVIRQNPTTGKWEVWLPPKEQQFIVKSYGSKASAQSAKSRGKHKDAIIEFNSKTGKWELKIPTGPKPVTPITPTPTPTPTPPPTTAPGTFPAGTKLPENYLPGRPLPPSASSLENYKFTVKSEHKSILNAVEEIKAEKLVGARYRWHSTKKVYVVEVQRPMTAAEILKQKKLALTKQGYIPEVSSKQKLAEEVLTNTETNQEAINRIVDYERKVRWRSYETAMVFDSKTGRRLSQVSQHHPTSVSLPHHSFGRFVRDNIDMHNHPGSAGGSYSPADLKSLFHGNPIQSRISSRDFLYIIDREGSSFIRTARKVTGDSTLTFSKVGNDLDVMHKVEQAKWRPKYISGELTHDQYYNTWTHEATKKHAKKYGYNYRKVKYTESYQESQKIWQERMHLDLPPPKHTVVFTTD
jgi:SPP1 gp7 family putative phage head morphogenesis protein